MKILIFGATGTAGSEVVTQAITDKAIDLVTVATRKPLDFTDDKLKVIVRNNFLDYSDLSDLFSKMDACIWCLGISQTQVTKEQYVVITHDYVVEAAKALVSANPEMAFVFLSGQGSDSTEKSRILFARIKGKAENALKKLPIKYLYILRPGGIIPHQLQNNLSAGKRRKLKLMRFLFSLFPRMGISTVQLAQAMLTLVKNNTPSNLLENEEIKKIVNYPTN